MPKSKCRKKTPPKRVLALPDLEHAKTAVLNSLTSRSGQQTYDHAIREFVALVLFGTPPSLQPHRRLHCIAHKSLERPCHPVGAGRPRGERPRGPLAFQASPAV
jgi:hypothetical protein